MTPAYNTNTTTVQDARNRYNALLAQALERIKARKTDKTAQEPDETTATPEEVTTTATDMYHGYLDDKTTLQAGRIRTALDKPVRLDNNGPVLTWLEHIERLWRDGGLWGYKHLQVYTDYKKSGETVFAARCDWYISTPQSRADYDRYYTANKTVVEYVKYLLALSGEDATAGDPTELEVLRYDARLLYLDICKIHTYDAALVKTYADTLATYYTLEGSKSKKEVAEAIYNDTMKKSYKMDFSVAVEVRRYLKGLVKQATEDDATAHEDTPVTAPQAIEEVTTEDDTTTAETHVQEPENVTTEESPEMTVEQEDDNTPVLLDLIKRYGNTGADYLDTLDYNQATEQVYSTKRGNSTKVTERYYTIDGRTIYGLYRRYNRNGKRAEFVVYQDGQKIETRAYGKNNSCYKAEIQYNGGEFVYNVTDGKITGGYYTTADKLTIVRFDDNNRPATPRDLPAPAPSKTAKEVPATTVQEHPTSKYAPTPEATTAPEEVQPVTTSKQEDDTPPYWLLLDNELKAQQEEQETTPATPDKSEEEPEEQAPATETTDDPEEVVFLKGVELNKVIEEFADKNGLDLKEEKRYYDFYATADGYFTKLRKQKPRKDLYIADEGPYYDKYGRGEITDKDIFFSQNMRDASFRQQMPLYTPESGKLECGLFVAVCRYKTVIQTVPSRPASPREFTVYKAIYELYLSDYRTRLEKYWERYSDKVCVNTYWRDR